MNIKEKVKLQERITAKFYDQRTLSQWQKAVNKMLVKLRKTKLLKGYDFSKLYQFGKLIKTDEKNNVICDAGFNVITKRLTGDTTYTGFINKALLGTGTTGGASASDTQLEVETYRNDVASGTDSGNIAILTILFTETEVAGTFTEFGNCIDGTTVADTGQLWSHVKGLNWVKDNATALVVSCKYTFVSA